MLLEWQPLDYQNNIKLGRDELGSNAGCTYQTVYKQSVQNALLRVEVQLVHLYLSL